MRCTGDTPSCDRCQHLRFECSYPDSRTSRAAQTTSNGGNILQVALDIEQRDSPAGAVEASTANSDTPGLSISFNPTSHTGDAPLLPDEATMVHVFDNFFQHLYHVPVLSFLHRASLVQRYKSGLRDEALLHVWWRQCHCDLYRIVLDGLHEALPSATIHQLDQSFVMVCQQQCFEKATEIVGIFKVILSIKTQLPFLDFHLPICAYQCARLLFYSYRTKIASFPMSAEKVTEQAQRCLDIVKACTSPWKGLLTIQKDLDTLIQRGCSRSPSPSPAPEDLPGGTQRQPSGPASSQQMFSRHSLIKRIGIVDDSDNLSMPPLSQAASTSTPSIAQSGLQRSTGFDTDTTAVGDMQTVEVALVQDPLFAVVPSTPIRGSDAFDGALDCPLRLPGSFGLYPWDWPCEPWPARYDLPAPSMGPDNFSGNMWTNWTT